MGADVAMTHAGAKQRRAAIVPGAESWERWDFSAGEWKKVAVAETPAELGLRRVDEFGVPASAVTTLALGVTAPDADALRGAVALQMERRGMDAVGEPGKHNIAEIGADGDRRFGLGIALTRDEMNTKDAVAAARCSVGCALRGWPPDSLLFWKEIDAVILGITGENGLKYFQTIGGTEDVGALLLRARCAALWLFEMGWLSRARQLASAFREPDMAPLARALGLPFAVIEEPPLSIPKHPWTLTPTAVRECEKSFQRAKRVRGIFTFAAAAVLAAGAVFAFQIFELKSALEAERRWLASKSAELASIREVAARWEALEPAISPEAFPLEMLQRCAALLPSEGARFTEFLWNNGVLSISGESASPGIAYGYLEALKNSDSTREIEWSMPEPRLQTNDLAVFDIQGRTIYAQALAE